MRWSEYFLPTLKQESAEAEVISHRLMLRAGLMRKLAAGVYSYLPLGLRVIHKVERIIREEMNRAGAQEVLLPVLHPIELWQESGREGVLGKELVRLKDRHGREFALGPTHEEVITDLVRKEVRSYRQLPLNLYQIQIKFRDEIRPRFGAMRAREFIMKDAYSFDRDEKSVEISYRKMFEAYSRIFERCGLRFKAVEADPGPIGGSFSHEFMVLAETGEDALVNCQSCSYAANIEKAECVGDQQQVISERQEIKDLEIVPTPNIKTVEELCRFLGKRPEEVVKTLLYQADEETVAVLIRGDHEINETKLRNFLKCNLLSLADPPTIERITGAPVGFSGPVGLDGIRLIADRSVVSLVNMVTGANRKDAHLLNVNLNRDFKVDEVVDIRKVKDGDLCPRCGGRLVLLRGIEVGHVFKLGIKYSKAMGATFLDENGEERPFIMGCYGIGVTRIIAAAIEQNNDEDGIIWPLPIAPFQVLITPVNVKETKIYGMAVEIYEELKKKDIEVLLDDRDERPGVKFKDADLIGIPIRLTIGANFLKEGKVEIRIRRTREEQRVGREEVLEKVKDLVSCLI